MGAILQIGRYRTLRPIASGGMATVYLGQAEGAEGFAREVAIKVMHPHLATDDEFVTMFLDEARMVSGLRHPNVVPTLDVAREGQRLFLVMEYVDGEALHHLLKELARRDRRMPLPVALRIVLDLLDGLHAAHELRSEAGAPINLVHRDVSPHNVLVGAAGVSRIMDFGIARAETRVTSTREGQLKGKLSYMSPEQLLDRDLDRRSDVYAAGLVLWEVLVGRRTFDADSEGALVHMVMQGPEESPREAEPSVPEPISEACMRALLRDPKDRFQSAAAFAQHLEAAARQAGIAIATPREVAALFAELPRSPEGVAPEPGETVMPSSSAVQVVSRLRRRGRSRTRDVVMAAIAASLLTGGVIWLVTRSDPSATAPASDPSAAAASADATAALADATAASADATAASADATAASADATAGSQTAAVPATALPTPSASADATATATATAAPVAMPLPKWRPPPPPKPETFRPEEP